MTRLPQLEQELVAAAARLGSPRRVIAPAARVAIAAAGAGLAVLAVTLLLAGSPGGGEPAQAPAGPDAVPAGAPLEDVLGIFREPIGAGDEMRETDPPAERQPGEDPSQARRVDWPGEEIFMWPMTGGVCYSQPVSRFCVPLGELSGQGLAVSIESLGRQTTVSGPVVDGIEEIVLEGGPGGARVEVPVRDNFFFLDLKEEIVERLSWTYAGREHGFDLGRMLRVDPVPAGPKPVDFTAGGRSYTAFQYTDDPSLVCVRVTQAGSGKLAYDGCTSALLVRQELPERPAHIMAGGALGDAPETFIHPGYARADVVEVRPVDPESDVTVALSEPWRPEGWEGDPIRMLLALEPGTGTPDRVWPRDPLEAELEDGSVIPLPAP